MTEVEGLTPSPATVARSAGIEPSDGPAGDASIDRALDELATAVSMFDPPTPAPPSDGGDPSVAPAVPDAGDVLRSGQHLHAVLQQRLDEAAG